MTPTDDPRVRRLEALLYSLDRGEAPPRSPFAGGIAPFSTEPAPWPDNPTPVVTSARAISRLAGMVDATTQQLRENTRQMAAAIETIRKQQEHIALLTGALDALKSQSAKAIETIDVQARLIAVLQETKVNVSTTLKEMKPR